MHIMRQLHMSYAEEQLPLEASSMSQGLDLMSTSASTTSRIYWKVFSKPLANYSGCDTERAFPATTSLMAAQQPWDYIAKIIALGDSGSGKSSVRRHLSPVLSTMLINVADHQAL